MRETTDLWVFGYGSLIWRVDFPIAERQAAHIRGWERRFWQGSSDHRGVPGQPGRVATLIAEPEALCHGVALRISPDDRDTVLDHLDYREKNGYERTQLTIYLKDGRSVAGLTYHATEDNQHFLGEKHLLDIARQIADSLGPSGTNSEYLLELHSALVQMGVTDDHIEDLVHHLKTIETANKAAK